MQELFDGPVQVAHNLHPPILRPFGVGKIRLGRWIRPLLLALYRCRRLRRSRLDPFAYSRCRRLERELITWYEDVVERVVAASSAGVDVAQLLPIVAAVDRIRGFEQIKQDAAKRVQEEVAAAFTRLADVAPSQ